METLRRHVEALTTQKLAAEGTALEAERKLRRTEMELLRLEEENEQLYAELSKTNPTKEEQHNG